MSRKKKSILIVVIILVLAAAAGVVWYLLSGRLGVGSNGDKVYVESVKTLTATGTGLQDYYPGKVEPQQSWEIKKNSEKTVKEVYVKEGDQVDQGTPLFEYDTQEIKDEIAQDKLELAELDNDISDYYNQISVLETERNNVSEDEKFQYTTEIQSIQTSIKQTQYNKESKQVEISNKEEALKNSVVTSEIAGVIKSINEDGAYDPYTGEELPYMTVLATGSYRVKGTISSQNVWSIAAGTPVIIRSRLDENQTWNGTITEVDTESAESSNGTGTMTSVDGGSDESSAKYPFYIELDHADGLILGQHVYIDMSGEQQEEKEGIWLYESYIVTDDSGSFVWADNGKGRLEKRTVELGEYEAETGSYEILSGLTEQDHIAFPMETLYEGVVTVTDETEVDYTSPMYMEQESQGTGDMDGEGMDGGVMEEGLEGGYEGDFMEEGLEEGSEENLMEEGLEEGYEGDFMEEGAEETEVSE